MDNRVKTIKDAVDNCKNSGLTGWELVEYAQKLVANKVKYSYCNSFDMPEKAFEKGMGYCWHQSGALNLILKSLGFHSGLVYGSAFVNSRRFKELQKLKEQTAAGKEGLVCTCKKKSCPRYKKCDECRAYHYGKGGRPHCERR